MKHLVVIGGPTASGKSALAISLAQKLQCEIISADSRQFYRGMDIGTAKVSSDEQALVPHHFIDHCDPDELFSAGQFANEALAFLEGYFERSDWCVAVGGSGLYLRALCEGFDPLPQPAPQVREALNERLSAEGIETLAAELQQRDPQYAASCDLKNPQRIIRALEVMQTTGTTMSEQQTNATANRPFNIHKIALLPPREWLYERINHRVDEMVEAGLLEEVKSLLPYRDVNALKTVGYAEIIDHLDGKLDLPQAVEKIKQHTRNYAKRQYTWFRNKGAYHPLTEWNSDQVYKQLIEGRFV